MCSMFILCVSNIILYISRWTTIQHKVKTGKAISEILYSLKGCVELANSPKVFIYKEITGYRYCICSKSL